MGEKGICIFYVATIYQALHQRFTFVILFIPHRKLIKEFFFSPPDKEIEDQRWNHSLKVTQLLTGSEVYVLSTTYQDPQGQGLHGSPNTDSKIPFYVVSTLRVPCSFPVWEHTAPKTISRTLERWSSVSPSAQARVMEQGQASSWDMKQDELSQSSCQLPSPLLICWSMPRPAWDDAGKGHHGRSYTPPDCSKIKAQVWNRPAPWKPTNIVS